jgi:hypothetical protein
MRLHANHNQPSLPYLKAIAQATLFLLTLLLPTAQTQEREKMGPEASGAPLILAHYMPWYEARPESRFWGWHWTMNHFNPVKTSDGKRDIASHFYPTIGPYDSGDSNVIRYHFLLMKIAGIDGIIIDWYGLKNFRDYAKLHANTTKAIDLAAEFGLKVVICYEDQTVPILVESGKLQQSERVPHVIAELQWLQKNWFHRPGYLTFHDNPVMISFGQTGLSAEEWEQVFQKSGLKVSYFSQHHRRPSAVGAFDWPIPTEALGGQLRFNQNSRAWPVAFPVAFPRFVDIYAQAGIQDSYGEIADRNGQTLRDTLANARSVRSPFIQIATWNDWGEGTQIEPSAEQGTRDLEIIQQFKRSLSEVPFGYTRAMLSWPLRLYQLRTRPQPPESERMERAEQFILDGNHTEAQILIEQMERQR